MTGQFDQRLVARSPKLTLYFGLGKRAVSVPQSLGSQWIADGMENGRTCMCGELCTLFLFPSSFTFIVVTPWYGSEGMRYAISFVRYIHRYTPPTDLVVFYKIASHQVLKAAIAWVQLLIQYDLLHSRLTIRMTIVALSENWGCAAVLQAVCRFLIGQKWSRIGWRWIAFHHNK